MKGNMKRFLAAFLSSLMVLGMASGVYADTPETQSQTENRPQEGTESQGNDSLTPKPGSSESQKTTETEESGKQSPQTQNPEKDTDTGSADSKKTTQGKTMIAPSVSGTPEASKVPEGSDDTDTSGKDSGKAQSEEKNSLEPDGREDSENPAISGAETEETQAERKFEIQKTELKKDQGQLIVTVYTENNDYDRIYIGSREDTDKTPVIEGIKQVMGGYSFRFQVEEEKLGQRLTVVPGVTEEDSWYTDKDVYCDIPEMEEEQGFLEFSAVDSLQDQAVMSISEGTDNSGNAEINAQKPDGTTFPMFNIEKSTAQVNGDQIDIVLYLKANASGKFTYSEIYLGSKEDEEKTPTIKENVNESNQQVYSFSVPLSVQGTNVKFVPIKADGSHEIDLAQKISDKIMCVKGDVISHYGVPEEIFREEIIRDLYEIDNGFVDPCFGSIELPRPEGEPEIFVLSSCGTGIPVFRSLQKENIPFAAGILYTNDIDYQLARLLAARVVTEEPFREISGERYREALELMSRCGKVINAGVRLGSCNRKMVELIKAAEKMEHYICLETRRHRRGAV